MCVRESVYVCVCVVCMCMCMCACKCIYGVYTACVYLVSTLYTDR